MVATEIAEGPSVLEFGCGNGRDSLYLASRQHTICATDLSLEAVKSCRNQAQKLGVKTAHFDQGDLSSLSDMQALFKRGRDLSPDQSIIGYSRFVMHSINTEQEDAFMTNIGALMKLGEPIYFEFRSKEDAELEKTFGNHYRRFVDTEKFVGKLTQKHGFKLTYGLTSRGLAKYKAEDPFVSRLIFEKE